MSIATSEALIQRLQVSVQHDPATGHYRCRRDIFTDPELFEAEMRHIGKATGSISPTRARSRTPTTTSPAISAASRSSSAATARAS